MEENLPFAKKSLGQHWLSDPAILETIAGEADVAEGDQVIEIGPGTGTLTRVLLKRNAEVTAIEYDITLAEKLRSELPEVNVVTSDVLKFNFSAIEGPYKIVANIPYYLTSNLIRLISEADHRPDVTVLLVQKEVAERAAAKPGDMSLLSVSAQFYWDVQVGVVVPPRYFTPPPKVDSQTLILKKRELPLFVDIDERHFFRVVKAGFSNRRKTLLNSLSGGMRKGKDEIRSVLQSAGIKETTRPQELSLTMWYDIAKALTKD